MSVLPEDTPTGGITAFPLRRPYAWCKPWDFSECPEDASNRLWFPVSALLFAGNSEASLRSRLLSHAGSFTWNDILILSLYV